MKIAVEGIDGAGKTTISKILSEKYKINYIKFPRYDFIPPIRQHLFGEIELDDKASTLLFLADIIQGTKNLNNYIADRFFFSTIAYSKLSLDVLMKMINILDLSFPDYVLYLKIDVNLALSRLAKKFEQSKYDRDYNILKTAFERYEKIFNNKYILSKTKVITLDGSNTLDEILDHITTSIKF